MAPDRSLVDLWPEMTVDQLDLPTPTVQAHAANLLALPDGDVLCAWFGGTQEGLHDINIHVARLPVGADAWSAPVKLSGDPERSEQNPVPFLTPDGAIWMFWTAQVAGAQDGAEVRARVSHDLGWSWDEELVVFRPDDEGGVFVRQPPVVRSDGAWVVPVFRCGVVDGQPWSGDADHSAVRVSHDDGVTWTEIEVPESDGLVHMCVVPVDDGSYVGLFRSRTADFVYRSSADASAERWSSPTPTPLPNNNSSIQATSWTKREIVIVYNHSSARDASARRASLYDEIDGGVIGEGVDPVVLSDDLEPPNDRSRRAFWGAPRAPLSLASSTDHGRTWTRVADLATGDGYCLTNNSRDGLNRELSYPSVIKAVDGSLHVAFTYHRRLIRHLRYSAR